MKTLALIVLAALGLIAFGCHELTQDDKEQRIADQQWMQFSEQHHCKIAREHGWFEANAIWQCDGGFQVRRRDNQ